MKSSISRFYWFLRRGPAKTMEAWGETHVPFKSMKIRWLEKFRPLSTFKTAIKRCIREGVSEFGVRPSKSSLTFRIELAAKSGSLTADALSNRGQRAGTRRTVNRNRKQEFEEFCDPEVSRWLLFLAAEVSALCTLSAKGTPRTLHDKTSQIDP